MKFMETIINNIIQRKTGRETGYLLPIEVPTQLLNAKSTSGLVPYPSLED